MTPNDRERVAVMAPFGWITAMLLVAPLVLAESAAASPTNADLELFIAEYCLDCHDSAVQKGGVNIEEALDGEWGRFQARWETILGQIEGRQMPPLGKRRPSEEDYMLLSSLLVEQLDQYAAENPNPGRTDTVRRLTRTEYGNAVRDLLGIDGEVAEWLPADESSHGFDNVTVGELSPSLLDRYIGAARKISRIAMGREGTSVQERTIRIPADVTQEDHVEGLPLGTRGGTLFAHRFPRSGEYEVKVLLTRDRNEMIEGLTREHQIEVLVDGEPVAEIKVTPPEDKKDHTLADANLAARFEVETGMREIGVTFRKQREVLAETLRQPYEAHFNFHRHPRLSPAIFQVSIIGPFIADLAHQDETPTPSLVLNEIPTESIESQARTVIAKWLRFAWRRPVTDEDVDRIMPFFESGREETETLAGGLEAALSAILVSREFLFKIESDPEGVPPRTPYFIHDLEMATRLSFFIWSSLPDDELVEVAARGDLTEPSEIKSQVRRMLADERARSLVTNFADQWLHLRNLASITPDGRLFPGFDDNLRQAFREETEWLFETVMREDRSVLDLLTMKETYLNERLAKHYEIPHVYGTRFREVSLPEGSKRGGLLRHGSILTVTSYANRTSPVIRGNWILENILGTPPPPPPPNVPALEETSVSEFLPIRERLAAHRNNIGCASCHNVIDPVGFALENFDAVGQWREMDQGVPVDARGGFPDGSEFVGVDGLEAAIMKRPEWFVRCLTEKLLIYGLGRGMEPTDAATIRGIERAAARSDYRFADLIVAIALSDPFRMRMSRNPLGLGEKSAKGVH